MKSPFFYCAVLGIMLSGMLLEVKAETPSYNRVVFSLGLSGHVFLGVGVEHGFNPHHAVQLTFYPVFFPGKGFPLAVCAGYGYHVNGSRWQVKIGGEFALLVSPPDPQKRRVMPLLNLVPGVQYRIDEVQVISTRLWISYFLGKANVPIAPTVIEFSYGRKF